MVLCFGGRGVIKSVELIKGCKDRVMAGDKDGSKGSFLVAAVRIYPRTSMIHSQSLDRSNTDVILKNIVLL